MPLHLLEERASRKIFLSAFCQFFLWNMIELYLCLILLTGICEYIMYWKPMRCKMSLGGKVQSSMKQRLLESCCMVVRQCKWIPLDVMAMDCTDGDIDDVSVWAQYRPGLPACTAGLWWVHCVHVSQLSCTDGSKQTYHETADSLPARLGLLHALIQLLYNHHASSLWHYSHLPDWRECTAMTGWRWQWTMVSQISGLSWWMQW